MSLENESKDGEPIMEPRADNDEVKTPQKDLLAVPTQLEEGERKRRWRKFPHGQKILEWCRSISLSSSPSVSNVDDLNRRRFRGRLRRRRGYEPDRPSLGDHSEDGPPSEGSMLTDSLSDVSSFLGGVTNDTEEFSSSEMSSSEFSSDQFVSGDFIKKDMFFDRRMIERCLFYFFNDLASTSGAEPVLDLFSSSGRLDTFLLVRSIYYDLYSLYRSLNVSLRLSSPFTLEGRVAPRVPSLRHARFRQPSEGISPFDMLPDEVLAIHIFPRVLRSPNKVLRYFGDLCLVSKRWYAIVNDNLLWKQLYIRQWMVGHCSREWMGVGRCKYFLLYHQMVYFDYRRGVKLVDVLPSRALVENRSTVVETWMANACLKDGSWYVEVQVNSNALCYIGVASHLFRPRKIASTSSISGLLGADFHSWSYDGRRCRKCHRQEIPYGRPWAPGDHVGVLVRLKKLTDTHPQRASPRYHGSVEYFLNGSSLGVAWDDIVIEEGLFVGVSLDKIDNSGFTVAGGVSPASVLMNFGEAPFVHPPSEHLFESVYNGCRYHDSYPVLLGKMVGLVGLEDYPALSRNRSTSYSSSE